MSIIFSLVEQFAVSTAVAIKIVDVIETADTVVTVVALLGTLITTAGIGTAAIAAGMAMFKKVAKKVGKRQLRKL